MVAVASPGAGQGTTGLSSVLEDLHGRLDHHFSALRSERERTHPGRPVFALEHGLVGGDLTVLNDSVRAWIRMSAPSRRFWLPFVIYAAEIGYRYEGEEYWPTFEASTPGWNNDHRDFIKRWFKEFARAYGGAVPAGPWAENFNIICWPITHAILPTDLQRQLARLLYDYRGALTADLLADPEELGAALAARTTYTSKRFQQFAQNIEILGLVAAALLSGEEESGALLRSTLDRIVEDLSTEREARIWLRDAKQSADRVRMKGLATDRSVARNQATPSKMPATARPTAPVVFSLHPTGAGWQLRLRVPDYTPLFTRHPALSTAMGSSRTCISGYNGPPRPRGWLLHVGTEIALDAWPGADAAIFRLERAEERLNTILSQESRTPLSTRWLFSLGADGVGRIVRSGAVRPGGSYVLVGSEIPATGCPWVRVEQSACTNASAVRLDVPDRVQPSDQETLRTLGCGAITEVDVQPVGFVPALWDGQAYGEWLVGDEPLLMLSTSHAVRLCTMELDRNDVLAVSMDDSNCRAFVRVMGLTPGWHQIRFSFLTDEGVDPIPDAYLDLRVREPAPDLDAGTFREPIQILAHPPGLTLEDVWEGRGIIEVGAPPNSSGNVSVTLGSASGETTRHQFGPVQLPLESVEWRRLLASHVRGRKDMQLAYDDAVSGLVEVSNAELGTASLAVERSFTPLRWGFRRSGNVLALRLHEAADTGAMPRVERFSFATPDISELVEPDPDGLFRHEDGGLFVATLDRYTARAVLPQPVHDWHDMRRLSAPPVLRAQTRSAEGITALLRSAERWSFASVPGDPFAESALETICSAITREICGIIGGKLWASLERRHGLGEALRLDELETALAKPGDHGAFRRNVLDVAQTATVRTAVDQFAEVLGSAPEQPSLHRYTISAAGTARLAPAPVGSRFTGAGRWVAEYLLRLASEPGTLLTWAGPENDSFLHEVVVTPIALRGARMIVLARADEEWTWD